MVHHKMPEVSEKLAKVEEHIGSIRKMIQQDKSYPELMDHITKVHGELEDVEKVIVEDLAEHD
jgi:DNA-binding FrmR family transcriptional regulator